MVFKMEKVILLFVLFGLTINILNAEFTAENVYDFLSRRLDRLNVKVGIIQNEMKKHSYNINEVRNDSASSGEFQVKNMFDDFKLEINTKFEDFKEKMKFDDLEEKIAQKMNTKFADLEEKIAQKVDMKFADLEKNVAQKVDKKFLDLEMNVAQKVDKKFLDLEMNVAQKVDKKFLDLEKNVAQKVELKIADLEEKFATKIDIYLKKEMSSFLNNTNHQNKHALENEKNHLKKHFFGIQKSLSTEKHVIRNAINMFEDRVEDVEQKMFAFENASWKGEKGDMGHQGAPGPSGSKGERGESIKGEKGLKGETGYKGSKGMKGQKGSPETKKTNVYFHVSLSTDQSLPESQVIKFTKMFSNQGDGYDSTTGIFTAPYSGTYLFFFSVRVGNDKYDIAYVNLYTNGGFRAYAIDEAVISGHDTMGANAYVTHMSAGDKAWIQTGDLKGGSTHKMVNSGTTFTGIMLY